MSARRSRGFATTPTALAIEPDRIALQGHSAGGHLSLLAAGTAEADGAVAAVAAFYAPVTFHVGPGRGHGTTPASSLLGDDATEEDAREASPLSHVSPGFPPTFFLHGGADRIVVPSASVVMYDALRSAGVETDLHLYAGQAHAFDRVDTMRQIVNQEVALFFRRMVSDRAEIEQQIVAENPFATATA